MPTKRPKKDSSVVDKQVMEVDRLHAKGMSVNKACQQVGLQNTVYYFRKRKEAALEENNGVVEQHVPYFQKQKASIMAKNNSRQSNDGTDFGDIKELTDEYVQTKTRLSEIEKKLAALLGISASR